MLTSTASTPPKFHPHDTDLSASDLARLEERGLTPSEATRQLELLRKGPRYARLVRACRVDDGILRLSDRAKEEALERFAEAALNQRVSKFIPASGAATRMFKELAAWVLLEDAAEASPMPEAVRRFFDEFAQLALSETKQGKLFENESRRLGRKEALRRFLLGEGALCSQPKGLLPFHRAGNVVRTPFEEHCRETAELLGGRSEDIRLHFTVGAAHRESFERQAAGALPALQVEFGRRFGVTFSCQSPTTDTLALDDKGHAFRVGGELMLRPGGHGSLLANLEATEGDLVVVKNIDNIAKQPSAPSVLWQRILVGELIRLERLLASWREKLMKAPPREGIKEIAALLARLFGDSPRLTSQDLPIEKRRRALLHQIDRPLRVCGMVPVDASTGGGPFWVRQKNGDARRQIVESVEIDPSEPEQRRLAAAGTHFNPVLMVCALKSFEGIPHQLSEFSDPEASFITEKSLEGRPLLALERPGLWNGGMAEWNTLFIECDGAAFTPVKSVLDLLSPQHR
ncbi:MAG: DUF4301 family protein [Acidobacteriota bacterium]